MSEIQNYKTYIYYPGVPAEYTKLEYIQSTGTQYIDCGIKFTLDNRIEIGYEMTNPGADQSMFAVGVQGQGTKYAGHRSWNNGATQVFFINYGSRLSMTLTANTRYDAIFNNSSRKVIVNNTEIGTLGTNYVNPGNNMFIFAEDTVIQGVQQPWGLAKAKLYYFNMYQNSTGTIIYHLIPAKRKSDGAIGLWDASNGVFLTNAGTGTFIAGPEISEEETIITSYKTYVDEQVINYKTLIYKGE